VLSFSCSSSDFNAFLKFSFDSLFKIYCSGNFDIGGCKGVLLIVLVVWCKLIQVITWLWSDRYS
jgi:hypothetical protein